MTSTHILNNWEDGIHYCGDIDDLIDSIYEENKIYYELEEVLEKYYTLDNFDDYITELLISLEPYANSCPDWWADSTWTWCN